MSASPLFECHNLQTSVNQRRILDGIHLTVQAGDLHVIIGQNGSGKSTFLKCLAGAGQYSSTADACRFDGQNLLTLPIHERARRGLFLSFQHPPALPGLKLASLMKEAVSAQQGTPASSAHILQTLKETTAQWGFDDNLYKMEVNHTLSGGQQKMSEMLQAALLHPRLLLLDEIDSGLDMDSVKKVAAAIRHMHTADRGIVLVTHYRRIVDFLGEITAVHVMKNGQLVHTGDMDTFDIIEKNGYESF